jgi:hypothetical protein
MAAYDVTRILYTFDHKPFHFMLPDGTQEAEPATLRRVACQALVANFKDPIEGDEQVRRFRLATRIHENDVLEIAVKDVTLIQGLIAKVYGPSVTGPAWILLETPAATPTA